MIKNLVLWVVVAVVMMTAYQGFNSTDTNNRIDYTTFMTDVENQQVAQTKFNEVGEIFVTKRDGSKYTTVLPTPLEDRQILNDLLKQKVKVEGALPEQRSLFSQILISW